MNLRYTCSRRSPACAERPTVFVVDSDGQTSEALGPLIRSAACQIKVAATAEEFLAFPRDAKPGCLVTELHLPGMSGLDLQQHIRDRLELPIIFMSSHADVTSSVQAMKRGALEFLLKPLGCEQLLEAVREALDRSSAALHHMAQIQALTERYELLSRREREVMSLVVSGRLNKQVGGDLGISEITVKAHRGKMMRKMQAACFADLVNMSATLHA